jgi:S-adenosylmethionine:tRNA ribosyltransferase-isomerase
MLVSDFDFELPSSRIALRPADPRDSARLLEVTPPATFREHTVRSLPALLRAGDTLVVNDTRVLPVDLAVVRQARRDDGNPVSIALTLLQSIDRDRWTAFARPAKRITAGDLLFLPNGKGAFLVVEEKLEDGQVVVAAGDGHTIPELLANHGRMPLPSYIAKQRSADSQDDDDYQTMFARREGAVAAPTAGLHFTPRLIDALKERGIGLAVITLHVGAGTFLPVKAERVQDHTMHAEWFEISDEAARRIEATRQNGGRVVAVGTTTLRAMESAHRSHGRIQACTSTTRLFLKPGDRIKAADMLFTNFHLPKSTLFMLVCAFSGTETMRQAYRYAIEGGFRFYSYGDACLLHRAV